LKIRKIENKTQKKKKKIKLNNYKKKKKMKYIFTILPIILACLKVKGEDVCWSQNLKGRNKAFLNIFYF